MKVAAIIQARMGSTRLPGKVIAPISGHPVLEVLVRRTSEVPLAERWLATSDRREDDVLAAWGAALGLRVFRGDAEDVLSRFAGILGKHRYDWVLRLTADDPFVSADILGRLIRGAELAPSSCAVVGEDWNARRFPLGFVPQIARAEAILDIALRQPPIEPHHRSHVLSWFYETGAVGAFETTDSDADRAAWRWTIDTADDLAMAQAAFEAFGDTWASVEYDGMVRVLDGRKRITSMNLHVRQRSLKDG